MEQLLDIEDNILSAKKSCLKNNVYTNEFYRIIDSSSKGFISLDDMFTRFED